MSKKKTHITEKNWKNYANVEYENYNDYSKNYRKIINSNSKLANLEQMWADDYLQEVIDFMGEYSLWKYFKNLDYEIYESKARVPHMNPKKYNARFSGSHWTGKKPGDVAIFDPYDEYQYSGSNQFCQTYVLMYLTGYLENRPNKKLDRFKKYYIYSQQALEFIKIYVLTLIKNINVIKLDLKLKPGEVKRLRTYLRNVNSLVDELLENPNMTFNCLELLR